MDLLDDKKKDLDLDDHTWRIYSADVSAPPAYIGKNALVEKAYLTQGSRAEGTIKNSVLFTDTVVAEKAKVVDSVLMPGVVVEEGATVTRALVADGVKIGKGAKVGSADSENILLVSKNVKGAE